MGLNERITNTTTILTLKARFLTASIPRLCLVYILLTLPVLYYDCKEAYSGHLFHEFFYL